MTTDGSNDIADAGPGRAGGPVVIVRGTCTVVFAFDIAMAIDLDRAAALAAGEATAQKRETLRPAAPARHPRKAPAYFEYTPAPLRVTLPAEPQSVRGYQTEGTVELLVFDFGAVRVNYRVPLDGRSLDELPDLSEALFDAPALATDARERVQAFAAKIGAATRKSGWTPQVEDYSIYEIREVTIGGRPAPPSRVLEVAPTRLAQVLRSERGSMSRDEIEHALAARVSYGSDDAAVIDWNAAVLLDREADDIKAVLEFANVELLEMRFLDDRLDAILDAAYASLQRTKVGLNALFPSGSGRMRRIAQLQMDSAVLFENVNNALKLIGDQYLARVYRMAAERFHLPEWDQAIERKLSTIEKIYTKMNDHEAVRRTDVLTWTIIVLIGAEIVLGLMRV